MQLDQLISVSLPHTSSATMKKAGLAQKMGFSVVRSFLEEKASPAIRTGGYDAGAGFEFQNILPDLTAPPMWQITPLANMDLGLFSANRA
jgi:hypothetical protein